MGIGIFPMPYGYYNILKVVVFISSVFMTFRAMKTQNKQLVPWLFGGLALLYNPLMPVHLNEKSLWIIMNAITALIFIVFRNLSADEEDDS